VVGRDWRDLRFQSQLVSTVQANRTVTGQHMNHRKLLVFTALFLAALAALVAYLTWRASLPSEIQEATVSSATGTATSTSEDVLPDRIALSRASLNADREIGFGTVVDDGTGSSIVGASVIVSARFQRPDLFAFGRGVHVLATDLVRTNANAAPNCYWAPRVRNESEDYKTISDKSGHFTIPRRGPSVCMRFEKAGYITRTLVIDDWSSIPQNLECRLHRRATLSIRVEGPNEKFPATCRAYCLIAPFASSLVQPSLSEGAVAYTLEFDAELASGASRHVVAQRVALLLACSAPGYKSQSVRVDLPNSSNAITISLAPTDIIGGMVTDNRGNPVPGATVHVLDRNPNAKIPLRGRRRSCVPRADGHFRMTVVGPELSVYAEAPGYERSKKRKVAVGALRADFVLTRSAGNEVTGRVLKESGGDQSGAWIGLRQKSQRQWAYIPIFVSTTSNESGSFSLGFVPKGIYGLFVRESALKRTNSEHQVGVEQFVRELNIEGADSPLFVEISVPRSASIRVEVESSVFREYFQDLASHLLPYILLYGPASGGEFSTAFIAKAELRLEEPILFYGVTPGEYVVRLYPGTTTKRTSVHDGRASLVRFSKGANVASGVLRGPARLVKKAIIYFGIERDGALAFAMTRTDKDGEFKINDVRHGMYTVRLSNGARSKVAFVPCRILQSGDRIELSWPKSSLRVETAPPVKKGTAMTVDLIQVGGKNLVNLVPNRFRRIGRFVAGEYGEFEIDSIGHGTYRLSIAKGSGDHRTSDVVVTRPRTIAVISADSTSSK
jgi:Carboxypeptidase regulatory-like domain